MAETALPEAVERYLAEAGPGAPLCVRVDAEFRVREWWGDPAGFGLERLSAGMDLRTAAPFVADPDPLGDTVLPFVNLGEGAAHVHLLSGGDGWYVLLVPATEALRRTQLLQQQANEIRLLSERQGRLLDELIEARSELEVRRDEAEAANRSKAAFIAGMSHEFRTPLTSVTGYAQLIEEDGATPPQAAAWAAAIRRAAGHLIALTDNILEQARIESGRLVIQPVDVRIRQVIDDLAAMIAPLAAEKGLAFAAYVAKEVPTTLLADDMRLKQVLVNLTGNAVKFTDSGQVEVHVCWHAGELRAVVRDTGPGIEVAQQARVFEAYHKAGDPRRHAAGAGLGLNIAAGIVRQMGGEITLRSEPGSGCEFTVCVPAPEVALGAPSAGPDVTGAGAAATVLIAEDDPDIGMLMSVYVRRAGYGARLATNGEEAVAMALAERPDLVLLDLTMPVLDGLAAARQLRERGFERAIVALTASRSQADRRCALEAGCTAFLVKPVVLPELLATIERLAGPARAGAR